MNNLFLNYICRLKKHICDVNSRCEFCIYSIYNKGVLGLLLEYFFGTIGRIK